MVLHKINSKLKYNILRSCKWKTKRSFFSALFKIVNLRLFSNEKLEMYKCRYCSRYHVGHTPKKITKKHMKQIDQYYKITLLGLQNVS